MRQIFFLMMGLMSGCVWMTSGGMTQAQVKNFETRAVDAPFDAVYAAATEALFDLGYVIKHSEKASGVIVGEKERTDTVWISGSQGQSGFWKEKITVFNLTLLIKPIDKKSSDVRIKTSVNGQTRFSKEAVDQVWVYIDRQVLMESPPKKSK